MSDGRCKPKRRSGRLMLHQGPIAARSRQAIVTRQRFSVAGALVFAGLLPFALRVLVLPDPYCFRLYFYKLSQWIAEPPPYRNRAAYGYIIIGEFIACDF